MAAPQGNYPPQDYPNVDPYAQPNPQQQPDGAPQPRFDGSPSPAMGAPPQPPGAAPGHGSRKKRAYAGQAYDFGTGPNAVQAGQPPGLGAYPGTPAAPYGAYPQQPPQQGYQQPGYQQPGYGAGRISTPPVGSDFQQQQQFGGVGGYQPPDQAYPGPGAAGMGGITNQFGQMNIGGQQAPPPQQLQHRAQPLNMLYATDLVNQPFHVSELDLPPPRIILPQNVGRETTVSKLLIKPKSRPALPRRQRPTVRQNMFDPL